MNKNLVLVQNGYPHSTTSGAEVDSLDITNFFKFEKNVVPSKYVNYYKWNGNDTGSSYGMSALAPFVNYFPFISSTDTILQTALCPSAYYEKEGALKYDNLFKHYSITFLLFAVRMQKGFLGTDVTIASRLSEDSPLKLRFCDIGESYASFANMNKIKRYRDPANPTGSSVTATPYKALSNALVIPTLNQYNHCFLAALFSDSAYLKESGTKLLNNEPLLNISWTETAFTTEG